MSDVPRASPEAGFPCLLVSMTSGQMIAEFEVASREVLEKWMQGARIHFEWVSRMDLEATRDEIQDL